MAADFPNLFAETDLTIPNMRADFQRITTPPPSHLIANVNIVPFVGSQCLVIVLQGEHIDIPGGTLEPGESYLQTAQRELVEEAGANLLNCTLFGAWHCQSANPKPYRPHLPHPAFYRLTGYGDVEQVGLPTNPPGGEQVIRVDLLNLDQAAYAFRAQGRPDLAELYQLAALIRSGSAELE